MNSNIIHPQIFAHHNCSEMFDIQLSGCSFEGLIKMSKRSQGGIVTVTFNSNFFCKNTNRGSNTSQTVSKSNKSKANANNNGGGGAIVERESFNLSNESAVYDINGSLKAG